MTQQIFEERALPIEQLEEIGIAKNGRILLEPDNLRALLEGRRSEMIKLENLNFAGFNIASLNAKLSLKPAKNGGLDILIHPLYVDILPPSYLTLDEIESLEKGETASVQKTIKGEDGKPQDVLVEFDRETNEFIITDTDKILVPDMVNSEYLTADQKERYRKGKIVELSDGTKFQFAGTERQGIRSDKLALIASVLVDGGLSYILYKGLNALINRKRDEKAAAINGKGYNLAHDNMQAHEHVVKEGKQQSPKDEQERGYTRTGRSR